MKEYILVHCLVVFDIEIEDIEEVVIPTKKIFYIDECINLNDKSLEKLDEEMKEKFNKIKGNYRRGSLIRFSDEDLQRSLGCRHIIESPKVIYEKMYEDEKE